MSIVDFIEAKIKEKGLSFKRVERECGLGNGTIKRWETQSPRLDGLIKVANYLQSSLDSLVFGSSDSELSCDGVPLSEDELDIVAMYRLLDERDKSDMLDYLTMKYEKSTGERASLYSTYTDTNRQQKSGPAEGDKSTSETA